MRKLLLLTIGMLAFWSAGIFALSIYNDIDENIHYRLYGPSQVNYYGKIKPGQFSRAASSDHHHQRIYIYFRRAYDVFFPFFPAKRDLICPELAYNQWPSTNPNGSNTAPLKGDAEIHVVFDGETYKCDIRKEHSS